MPVTPWWSSQLPVWSALGAGSGLLWAGQGGGLALGAAAAAGLLVGLAGPHSGGRREPDLPVPPAAAPPPARPVVPAPRRSRDGRGQRAGTEQAVRDVAALSSASEAVAVRFQGVTASLDALRSAIGEVAQGSGQVSGATRDALDRARAAAGQVDELLEASREIGDVTGVIASITDQTRTLALNATIEAARAGSAGRGFAVVAGEVKELAGATAQAARTIAEQVRSVQEGTRQAADAILEVTRVLGDVSAAQGDVGLAVERQTAAARDIERDVEQAARGSVQMAELVARRVDAEQRSFVRGALDVARELLDDAGGLQPDGTQVVWDVVDPSGARRRVSLPQLRLGPAPLLRNDDPRRTTPVVDEVKHLVGGTATLFQRLDADGAMLRVATNVVGPDGRRAVGTVLPARTADGSLSPVLAAVLAGRTYVGEAQVLGTDCFTSYAPLHDGAGDVVGMLFVGLPKQVAVPA